MTRGDKMKKLKWVGLVAAALMGAAMLPANAAEVEAVPIEEGPTAAGSIKIEGSAVTTSVPMCRVYYRLPMSSDPGKVHYFTVESDVKWQVGTYRHYKDVHRKDYTNTVLHGEVGVTGPAVMGIVGMDWRTYINGQYSVADSVSFVPDYNNVTHVPYANWSGINTNYGFSHPGGEATWPESYWQTAWFYRFVQIEDWQRIWVYKRDAVMLTPVRDRQGDYLPPEYGACTSIPQGSPYFQTPDF